MKRRISGSPLRAVLATVAFGLMFTLASAALAQAPSAKIEIKGNASQIDPQVGTFAMQSLTITTTDRTRYELRHDRHVTKQDFFSTLRPTDWVEVEGSLEGSTVSAYKIEIEH
jgi:hypothetical protein